jgi:predicted RNase H-like nuclease (RuvC/YqgF family)
MISETEERENGYYVDEYEGRFYALNGFEGFFCPANFETSNGFETREEAEAEARAANESAKRATEAAIGRLLVERSDVRRKIDELRDVVAELEARLPSIEKRIAEEEDDLRILRKALARA